MGSRWAVWLLLVASVAGCLDSEAGPATSNVEVVGDDGTATLANGTGAVTGKVLDERGLPLPGAHLALLGTDASATAGKDGSFELLDLPPGDHTLRVDAAEHHPVEEAVTVAADKLVEIRITMVPKLSAGPGYRSHVHDFWSGGDTLPITEFTASWPAIESNPTGTLGSHHCVFANENGVWGPPNIAVGLTEKPGIIVPGTGSIDVTLQWTPGARSYDTFAFAWSGADSEYTQMSDLIAPGETVSLPVTPEMWDSSHQAFTLWDFYVCRDKNTPGTDERSLPPEGDVQVTMTLNRMDGPIPPEPAHPLFWENGTTLPVVTDGSRKIGTMQGLFPAPTRERTGTDSAFRINVDEAALIPPGTGTVTARLEWSYAASGAGVAIPDNDATPPWGLAYKSADLQTLSLTGPDELLVAPIESSGPGWAEFLIDVEPIQTDAFYQSSSNWYFYLGLEGEEQSSSYTHPCPCDISFTLQAQAHQDPAFTEG